MVGLLKSTDSTLQVSGCQLFASVSHHAARHPAAILELVSSIVGMIGADDLAVFGAAAVALGILTKHSVVLTEVAAKHPNAIELLMRKMGTLTVAADVTGALAILCKNSTARRS